MLRKIRFNIPILFNLLGAYFFWGITFGEGHFNQQLITKYKTRNISAGIIILSVAIFAIFGTINK